MRSFRACAVLAFIGGVSLVPSQAFAQSAAAPVCVEGRMASGACVDATLGSMLRERTRVFAQPRLSYSGPAVPPSEDRRYDALRDWGQGLMREIFNPCAANFCP